MPVADVAMPWSLPSADVVRTLMAEAGFQRIEVVPKSLDVAFPSADQFIELTVLSTAAVVPAIDHEDPAARAAFTEAVAREAEPVVQDHREGDMLTFRMFWIIATAYAA